MNLRSVSYWIACIALALAAAHGAAGLDQEAAAMTTGGGDSASAISETARAVLLALGILAVAFFYRRAWMNICRRTAGR